MVSEHIFRAYDIRGIVGKDLFPGIISKCATIFANMIEERGGKHVAISGDVRLSTPSFIHAAISGVTSAGIDATFYYPLPIPVFNFYVWTNNFDGGAYVTASHNPPDYNGIRFRHSDGTGFAEENKEIKRRFFANQIKTREWDKFGSVYLGSADIVLDYISFALENILAPERKLKVVIDGKFGAANLVVPELFNISKHNLLLLNSVLDGNFPGGMPDPLHGDTTLIRDTMKSTHADIGIAYDGDGDRAAFFDEKGRIIPAEIIALFLAENMLKSGDTIVYNVMCSSIIKKHAEELGIKTVECKVGDVFVAKTAKEVNARICVEESYHFFLPLYGFYYDDSILTSLLVVNLLSRTNKRISDVYDMYGEIQVIRENIPVSDEIKFSVIEKFREWATKNFDDVSTIDGVKIYLEDTSFLARPSNTEPLIRVVAEGIDRGKVVESMKMFMKKLKEIIDGF